MRKLMMFFTTVALAVASAASKEYRLNLTSPAWVGSTQLQAGDYRIQVEGEKAIIKSGGRQVAEAPAVMETAPQKYAYTSLSVTQAGGRPTLQEVRLGGTNSRIVFKTAPAEQAAK